MLLMEISILTLNIWGIPYVSKDLKDRVTAIGEVLASGNYDIVSLQEVWSEADFQYLKKRVENVLPFAHYFYSGVVGSGLAVLSRFPIVSAFFHQYSVNGYMHRVQHGDWFGGKGVGLAKISVNGQLVNVYIAHLHAEYNRQSDDYKVHRVIQAFDTAQFIESTRGQAVLQVLAGDLNTEPGDLAYRVLVSNSKLIDGYVQKMWGSQGTNEVAENSYTAADAAKQNPNGKRIDYVLFRAGDGYDGHLLDHRLPLPYRVPGQQYSYSDHEAVYAKLILQKISSPSAEGPATCSKTEECDNRVENEQETVLALTESVAICNESLKQLESHRRSYSMLAIAIVVVLLYMMDLHVPFGLYSVHLVFKFLLCACIIFFVFMATIWNVMERHGILSGKLTMEIALQALRDAGAVGSIGAAGVELRN